MSALAGRLLAEVNVALDSLQAVLGALLRHWTTLDPVIEGLQLDPVARQAAYALKDAYPGVVFLSGRRTVESQARAMAKNMLTSGNQRWIQATYVDCAPIRALQEWVDRNPQIRTVNGASAGLLAVLQKMTEAERGQVSKHLAGRAFDIQPIPAQAQEITAFIRRLPGLSKFLDHEGNLVRWHAQF